MVPPTGARMTRRSHGRAGNHQDEDCEANAEESLCTPHARRTGSPDIRLVGAGRNPQSTPEGWDNDRQREVPSLHRARRLSRSPTEPEGILSNKPSYRTAVGSPRTQVSAAGSRPPGGRLSPPGATPAWSDRSPALGRPQSQRGTHQRGGDLQEPEDVPIGIGELCHHSPSLGRRRYRELDTALLHPGRRRIHVVGQERDPRVPRLQRRNPLAEVENEPIPRGRDEDRVPSSPHGVGREPELLPPPLRGPFGAGDDYGHICEDDQRCPDVVALLEMADGGGAQRRKAGGSKPSGALFLAARRGFSRRYDHGIMWEHALGGP